MMAMKRIGPTVGNQRERKKVLNELDFVLECHDYANVVKFYGVKFNNEPVKKFFQTSNKLKIDNCLNLRLIV